MLLHRGDFNPAAMFGGGPPAAKANELYIAITNPGEFPPIWCDACKSVMGPS